MAKRISNTTETHHSPSLASRQTLSKSQIEEKIGMSLKDAFNTPFTKLINAANVRCDYYRINNNETTFSEGMGMIADVKHAVWYDVIRGAVLYERDSEELEDRPQDDRQIQINLTSKQSLVLGGTFKPVVGDHLVLHSHKKTLPKPFRVNHVIPKKLIDREVWLIEYSQSDVYHLQHELDAKVVRELVYVEDNVGTGSKVVVDASVHNQINVAKEILDGLQKAYVDLFYNEKWNGIYFEPYGFHGFGDEGKYVIFHYRALPEFQYRQQVMKWGYDRNTLFLTNTYRYDREEANYRSSLYETLRRRAFRPSQDKAIEDLERVGTQEIQWFQECLEIRDLINQEQEMIYPVSNYRYQTKLYFRSWKDHLILTPFINTDRVLVEMVNIVGFQDRSLGNHYVTYQLQQPYCCRFLDYYMDKDFDAIIQNIRVLEQYYPDPANIDDYFGIPLLLLVIQEAIFTKQKDNSPGTYA